jgi:26S proteasome regulatory subunit N1
MNAIFALGLTSAGTNHSRVAGQMRSLAAYYSEDNNLLLCVRIAQGLLHMGKGLLTLNPIHSQGFLVNNVALAGIVIAILSFTEVEGLICGRHQYLVYALCLAMSPKMAMLVDENLEMKQVQVLVGTAVDTVGQTGNPRTITGFQTHTAPVLIATGERAELSTEEYIPYSDVIEHIVIVRPNENYGRQTKKDEKK